MRRILLPLIALLVFACVASAASGERTVSKTVSITATGFTPDQVTIRPGDTVTWTNKDTTAHEIVSDTGIFKSNRLQPGESFSYRFDVESSYSYHDAMKASESGVVNVLTNSVSVGVTRMRHRLRQLGEGVREHPERRHRRVGDRDALHLRPRSGHEEPS